MKKIENPFPSIINLINIMKKYIICIGIMLSGLISLQAQHVFHAKSGKIVLKGNSHLVLKNTSYLNGGGDLQTDSATVRFSGTTTDSIQGLTTAFARLEIAKNGGNLLLKQDASITDSLLLSNGNIVLGDQNLLLQPGAESQLGSLISYVQTSATGTFQREVGNKTVIFPIGGSSYRPMALRNSGTTDVFEARVTDSVLRQGNAGAAFTSEVVASSWFISGQQSGGSDLELTLQWYAQDELSPFWRASSFISAYTNTWDVQPSSPGNGVNPYIHTRANLSGGGIFAIFNEDNTLPQISCPANITLPNDQDKCWAVVTYTPPVGTDNLLEPLTVLSSGLGSGSTFFIGTHTEIYTVTDASGNTASCAFDITVHDNQAPEISCPQNISVSNDAGVCGAIVNYSVSASDNCFSPAFAVTGGLISGSLFPIGTTTNSFIMTDMGGNSVTCSFDVTVTDDESPTISCPASITLANDPGQCGRTLTYITPNGQDNCSSNTIRTAGQGSGSFFAIGTTTESYLVTDASGHTASCSFSINIADEEAPTISLLGQNPIFLCQDDSYVEAGATASDNCDANVGQNLVIDNSTVNTAAEGNYTVTYAVTDVHGNSAQISRAVIVKQTPDQLSAQNCGNCAQIRFDFCEGETTPDLEALLTANLNYEPGAAFFWYADVNSQQGAAISTPVVNISSNNTQFYWVSQGLNACEGEARRVRVRVRKTSIVTLDIPAIGCGTAQIDLAAYVSDSRNIASGYTFYDADPKLGTSPVGSVSASNGQVNSGQYAVVSLQAGVSTYYAVASNNTGCQLTGSDEVNVGGGASLDPLSNLTVNAGDLVHVAFNSPNATHIYWLNHSSFNNPYIGLLGSIGMGDLVFTAQNLSSTTQTATIRAIAYNGNCAGEVRDFSITVNPGVGSRQGRVNSLQLAASKVNAHDVRVEWEIVYEFALEKIEIEKQLNEGEWVTVDQQDVGSDYNLTSSKGSDYNLTLQGAYLDRSGMGNLTRYRLKLLHPDGRAIWSQEVEINFDYYNSQRFTLYPNPSNGRFHLKAAGPLEGEWRYKLSDQLGRTILMGRLEGSETAFDISELPTAHYFLLLTSPEGKSYLRKVVKQ